MNRCPKCGNSLVEGEVECPSCGLVVAKFRSQVEAAASPSARRPVGVAAHRAPVARAAPAITERTMEALLIARPWMRFLAVFGLVVMSLSALGGILALFGGPRMTAVAVLYLSYFALGLPVLLPLGRAGKALAQLSELGTSDAVEEFAVHQATFWRRAGMVNLLGIVLAVFAVLLVVGRR